jgi:hypothetical protein
MANTRTFCVTNLIGDEIHSAARVKSLEKRFLEAAGSWSEDAVAALCLAAVVRYLVRLSRKQPFFEAPWWLAMGGS